MEIYSKDIVSGVVLLELREQLNANREYYYPVSELGQKLLELMQRKTFVPNEMARIKALGKAMGIAFNIKVIPNEGKTL